METIGRLQISVTANQLNVMCNKNEDFIYTTAYAINLKKNAKFTLSPKFVYNTWP